MAKLEKAGPRISVNKLAEFIGARAPRQRDILQDQKNPTDFKGPYYREAAEAIGLCIASNLEDLSSVERQIRVLAQQTPEKIGTQRRINANIDALETFKNMLDKIDLLGATPTLGPNTCPRLSVFGVDISVRPEIILRGKGKSGKALVGGIKLHFPRTFALSADTSGYVSAVMQEWTRTHLPDDGEVYGPYCIVIDVGSSEVYPGVKATANRMKVVTASCQNIVGMWPTI